MTDDSAPDTLPDNERPTDPAPPPESSVPPLPEWFPGKRPRATECFFCHAPINDHIDRPSYVMPSLEDPSKYDPETCRACHFLYTTTRPPAAGLRALDHHAVPVVTCLDDLEDRGVLDRRMAHDERELFLIAHPERRTPFDDPVSPDPTRGSFRVDAAGVVVPIAQQPARGWYDYGLDTGPRLRVKAIDVEPDRQVAPPQPGDPDPGDVREVHEAYLKATREDDDQAIAKLFPDVLDELHSKSPGAPPIPELDWSSLEPALLAEWKEWGQSHAVRGRSIAVRHRPDNGCDALVPLDTGDPYLITSDTRAVRLAWRAARGAPRQAAALIVLGATRELHRVRAGEMIRA